MCSRLKFAAVLCAAALFLATGSAAALNLVEIHNLTGKTITYLYVSPSGADSWEEDVLAPDVLNIRTLEHGYYCEVNLEMADWYDLKAVYRDGSSDEYYQINVRNNRRIELKQGDAYVY